MSTVAGSVTADATIEATISASVTADATIQQAQTGSVTADAAIQRTFSGSVTADANIVSTTRDHRTITYEIQSPLAKKILNLLHDEFCNDSF